MMDTDLISSLAVGMLWILILAMAVYAWRTNSIRKTQGYIVLKNAHTYTYTIGNNMYLYGGARFNGIEVALPSSLPHIYFDSQDGGGRHSNFYPDFSQMLVLEGGFSDHYRVFVPKKYEIIALSVLTPDVMATLLDYSAEFDVEIYKDKLRVISRRKAHNDAALQQALVLAATEIVSEIDDKLRTWTEKAALETTDQELHVIPARGLRIAGRHVSYVSMYITFLFSANPTYVCCCYGTSL